MIGSRSFMAKRETTEHRWLLVDATGIPVGRIAAQIAKVLMGKHKPTYTPHVDCGDFVVVVNVDKIALTGNKAQRTMMYRHTGYPGGIRSMSMGSMLEKRPIKLFEHVVRGMLPKTRLGRSMAKKLKAYEGPNHPHAAQCPEVWEPISRKEA